MSIYRKKVTAILIRDKKNPLGLADIILNELEKKNMSVCSELIDLGELKKVKTPKNNKELLERQFIRNQFLIFKN